MSLPQDDLGFLEPCLGHLQIELCPIHATLFIVLLQADQQIPGLDPITAVTSDFDDLAAGLRLDLDAPHRSDFTGRIDRQGQVSADDLLCFSFESLKGQAELAGCRHVPGNDHRQNQDENNDILHGSPSLIIWPRTTA